MVACSARARGVRSSGRRRSKVLALLRDGALTAQIAKRFPLTEAGAAMRYAESGGITGKVILDAGAPSEGDH
jgi:NADPH:quinone reductase-like Zn-dependent oxidoreductase